jgi:hypothetical protein
MYTIGACQSNVMKRRHLSGVTLKISTNLHAPQNSEAFIKLTPHGTLLEVLFKIYGGRRGQTVKFAPIVSVCCNDDVLCYSAT